MAYSLKSFKHFFFFWKLQRQWWLSMSFGDSFVLLVFAVWREEKTFQLKYLLEEKKALWWAWMNEKHQVFLVLFYDPRQKILSGRVGLRCRSFYCNKRKYMIKMVGENRSKSLVFVIWIFALKNLWMWFFCSLNFGARKKSKMSYFIDLNWKWSTV